MDTALEIIIEAVCTAVVIYIVFRESFGTIAHKIEEPIRTFARSGRKQASSGERQ